MTSASALGHHPDHAAVRPRARHRRRRAGRAGGDRRPRPQLPPEHADAALVPEGQPGRPADPLPRAAPRRRCRSPTLDEYARDADRAAHLDGQRRRAGAGLRRAEVRGARPARSDGARQRAASASTRSPQAVAERQRQPADRHALGPRARRSRSRRTGSSPTPPAYRPLIVAYRNGAPVRLERARPRRSTASRTTRSRPGSTATRGDRRSRSSASRGRTPSRSSTRSKALLPTFRAQLPASVAARHPLRPLGVDPRLGRRRASSRCC